MIAWISAVYLGCSDNHTYVEAYEKSTENRWLVGFTVLLLIFAHALFASSYSDK